MPSSYKHDAPMKPIDRIPSIVGQLYELVAELNRIFPGRRFTPDGHLVGSLGEVLASHYYSLDLLPCSSPCHDAKAADGRMVQIKATQGRSVALRAEPDFLLVIALRRDGEIDEAYNGPGREPWQNAGRLGKNGQRPISLSKLTKLAGAVPRDQRLPRSAAVATFTPEVDVRNRLRAVVDKLGEARFFLRELESGSAFESDFFTSAFGSACYSLCECLNKLVRRSSLEANKWWSETLTTLWASPMHRFFRGGRNKDIHEGDGLVNGFAAGLYLSGDELISTEEALLASDRNYSPGSPASECRLYFESLLRISLEGYRRFAEVWDPESLFAQELSALERDGLRRTH